MLCWKCRELVPYTIRSRIRIRTIGGKEYEYSEKYGECDICHEEIMIPGLLDENEQVVERMYRADDNQIVT